MSLLRPILSYPFRISKNLGAFFAAFSAPAGLKAPQKTGLSGAPAPARRVCGSPFGPAAPLLSLAWAINGTLGDLKSENLGNHRPPWR
jgi:hypothetical protein